jgi:type I restriction enzyme S subunit
MNIAGYDSCIGRGVAAIRSKEHQDWINFFVHANRENIYKLGSGSTFPNVSGAILSKIEIPIPSIAEQKQIVAILDEAFEGIDSAIANTEKNLANARELFESYLNQRLEAIYQQKLAALNELKQSILQKAFSGELTAEVGDAAGLGAKEVVAA